MTNRNINRITKEQNRKLNQKRDEIYKVRQIKIYCIGLAVIIFIFNLNHVEAQIQKWKIYSPPNKAFSIEIPFPLKVACEKINCGYTSVKRIVGDGYRYTIIEFDLNIVKQKFRQTMTEKEITFYLAVLLIGHDNAPSQMSEKDIVNNGLKGKEYSWNYRRGRSFSLGDRLYFITFNGEKQDEILSQDAERFLSSFKIHRIKSNRKKAKYFFSGSVNH